MRTIKIKIEEEDYHVIKLAIKHGWCLSWCDEKYDSIELTKENAWSARNIEDTIHNYYGFIDGVRALVNNDIHQLLCIYGLNLTDTRPTVSKREAKRYKQLLEDLKSKETRDFIKIWNKYHPEDNIIL